MLVAHDSDLNNGQRSAIAPPLPPPAPTGRPRADDRKTINGILHVKKTGCRWVDVPPEYGSDTTVWRRLRTWAADGTWRRIWQAFLAILDAQGRIDWERCAIDGSYVRAKGAATRRGAPAAA